ncbi:glycosyltransferase family 2 protein [Quadrisphaera sp. INWT6]|uniref:glycosyltransferase family 2 protein n=1 Tax=Quadrisphaera sp. INWT6 TaxID=2596917 RepID=UPI00189209F2|nr:galactosyltransferase-related protein [Quadrisphaera sp. INWT6]
MSGPTSKPTNSPVVAVLTIVAGRHDHLRGQLLGLAAQELAPAWHVVAAMGDPGVRAVLDEVPAAAGTRRVVVDVPLFPPPEQDELPLAAARNAAAAAAVERGAELLVLLDVDCVPSPALVATYARAAASDVVRAAAGPVLLCGPVAYLPPEVRVASTADLARLPGAAEPHRARPAPEPGEVVLAGPDQWWLFWSLSFATTARDWQRAGGFCEDYRGYGGEDTDVAATVRALDGSLFWVGGADAHHQHHPVESPPVRHLEAVVRNAAVFHRRWGWWPMTGWLERFREDGLVDYDAAADTWSLAAPMAVAGSAPDSAGDEAAASSTCS